MSRRSPNLLLHCVFCAVRSDADPGELRFVMAELEALRAVVEGMLDFRHGPNRDYEAKSEGHPYGFVIAFRDRAAHMSYDGHPRHKAAGARLVALCEGGADGIVVYDIEAE
ncbi:Dabb family protein [Rubellimicrobium mesophilum]|uniref:Dabb family protein n=1 Tax=Rubellimicrobium mesophilum TaxID=1123067 RepID=UPI00146FCFD1|nr:Dabb family protein [Rubellimicrobium mesophilum]